MGERAAAFGPLLRSFRMAAGLSQEELAERASLSVDGISALERGHRSSPRPQTVRLLADALDLDAAARTALITAAQPTAAPPTAAPPTAAPPTAAQPDRPTPAEPAAPPFSLPRLLPMPPTRLVGREREVAEIAFALRHGRARLVTLTGPGGVGKSRLAMAVAHEIGDDYDGATWVELAQLFGPPEDAATLVGEAIAQALAVRAAATRPMLATLLEAIGDRRLLLVIDNLEHLLPAGRLIAELLAACPSLTVVATSRERLRLRGELEVVVGPLEVPTPGQSAEGPTAGVSGVPAVRLFVERAAEVQRGFSLTEANASAVADVCRRLDGLPLAIELAVGWVKVLSPEALAARLTSRLPLLTGGAGDLPGRQRTMRDTIAWSHDLLSPAEQRLFRRLGVFAGGFTLEAAEAVASRGIEDLDSSSPSVLAGIASLVDKSLVRPMPSEAATTEAAPRFGMLDTVREFAQERLVASGEAETIREAHAAHFVALVQSLVSAPGHEAVQALDRLGSEVPNLRAVVARTVERGDVGAALRLAEAWQWLCWYSRVDSSEALRWLEAALALPGGGTRARVHALVAASGLSALRGDHERAETLATDAADLAEVGNYRFGLAYASFYLGVTAEWRGDLELAAARYEDALARFCDQDDAYWIALARIHLALVTLWRGDATAAAPLAATGLAGARAVGDDWGIGQGLGAVAAVACAEGEPIRAAALNREAFAVWTNLGVQIGIAGALAGLAGVAAAVDDYPRAARLLGAAAAVARSDGAFHLINHGQYERALVATQAGFDEDAFAAAWASGRSLSRGGIAALVAEVAPTTLPPTAKQRTASPPSVVRNAAAIPATDQSVR